MKENSLVRAATLLMIVTVLSKFFGFGREIVVAYLFGANVYTDSFIMALNIPTLIYGAVGGAITNVFIPIFDQFRREGRDKALVYRFGMVALLICILGFILPMVLFPNAFIRVFAPGFDADTIGIVRGMLYITAFTIIFRFFTTLFSSILHVHKNFVVPGSMSFAYNFLIISISLLLYRQLGIHALAWATFFALAGQVVWMLPWVLRARMGGSIMDRAGDGLRQLAFLLPPVLLGSMGNQVKSIVDKMFASTLAEGSISYLNYAAVIRTLPVSMLVTVVVTVAYPSLVSFVNKGDFTSYRQTIVKSMNALLLMMLPMTVGFLVFSEPMVRVIYQRGEFSPEAAQQTAYALQFLGLGLGGTMMKLLLVKAFYSLQDTKTPLIATLIMIVANVILNALLIGPMAHGGLALATSIAAWIGGGLLLWRLGRRIGSLTDKDFWLNASKALVASALMGIMLWLCLPLVPDWGAGFVPLAGAVGLIILAAMVLFLGAAVLLRVDSALEGLALARDYYAKLVKRFRR